MAYSRADVPAFPRHYRGQTGCLMTLSPAGGRLWKGDRFRVSGATLVLKRLTLHSHRASQTRVGSGGAFTGTIRESSRVVSDCPLPAFRSTFRRNGSLHTPCSQWAAEGRRTGWTVNAPGQSSRMLPRGYVRMAACAGWTEVVIPGDRYCLCNLPVDRQTVDANTRSGHGPRSARPIWGGAARAGAVTRRDVARRWLVSVSRNTPESTRCDESLTVWGGDGISCQNNQEVTL